MTSQIDPTLGGTLDGSGQVSADQMQTALETARDEISALQAASGAFTALSDTPSTYVTRAKQTLRVNATSTALEFVNATGHQDPGTDTVGDDDKTLVVGTAKDVQSWETTLTANRNCTLPTANLYVGLRYRITRSAGGSFYLRVSGLDAGGLGTYDLYQHEGVAVEYDGSKWTKLGLLRISRQLDLRDELLKNAKIEAYTEVESAVSPSAGTVTLDCSAAQVFVLTASSNVSTWALTNVDSAAHTNFVVYWVQDATGGRTAAWTFTVNGVAATAKWSGGIAPVVSSDANAIDVFQFLIRSASITTIYGFQSGAAFA